MRGLERGEVLVDEVVDAYIVADVSGPATDDVFVAVGAAVLIGACGAAGELIGRAGVDQLRADLGGWVLSSGTWRVWGARMALVFTWACSESVDFCRRATCWRRSSICFAMPALAGGALSALTSV